MEGVANVYDLKKDTITKKTYYEPRRYLSANVGNFYLPDDSRTAWSMSRGYYAKEAANTVSTKPGKYF